jgi:dephospho-CoA kinase
VFRDPDARGKLGNLIHPLVYRELARRLEAHRQREVQVVVLDIPLLLEGRQAGRGSGALLPFDLIVLVYADEETQLKRIMARDGLSHEDALARIRSQLPIEEKRALADVVIDNSGKWEATAQRVQECYEQWVRADGSIAAPA